jgi:hypothetical protein
MDPGGHEISGEDDLLLDSFLNIMYVLIHNLYQRKFKETH